MSGVEDDIVIVHNDTLTQELDNESNQESRDSDQETVPEDADNQSQNATFNAHSSLINIIDESTDYTCSERQMSDWLAHHGMLDFGTNYSVVAIMGSQSSGKSTLLNLLFGTEFDVLDASGGRQQTTKGVWLGYSPKQTHCLVMDVEGTDSGERGEDRVGFEQQSSLFALAHAEVLMINLFAHDVGRWNASNYGTLKNIFEANLQLFGHSGTDNRTCLLFVIRDHNEQKTTLAKHEGKIRAEIGKLWESISKPTQFESTPLATLFDVQFAATSNFEYCYDQFLADVGKLRTRFQNQLASAADSKAVPIDGLSRFLESNWTKITTDKDLDLPSQRRLLAIYRCDAILEEILENFEANGAAELKAECQGGFLAEFGARATELLREAAGQFQTRTHKYDQQVAIARASKLRESVLAVLSELFQAQCAFVQKRAYRDFEAQLLAQLPNGNAVCAQNFQDDVEAVEQSVLTQADSDIDSLVVRIPDGGEDPNTSTDAVAMAVPIWKPERVKQQLRERVHQRVAEIRSSQADKLEKEVDAFLASELPVLVSKPLSQCDSGSMWREVDEARRQCHRQAAEILRKKMQGLGSTEAQISAAEEQLASSALDRLLQLVQNQIQFLPERLQRRFENAFRKDENALPRQWLDKTQVRPEFIKARDACLSMLDLFFNLAIEDSDPVAVLPSGLPKSKLVLMTQDKSDRIRANFMHAASEALKEVEKSFDHRSKYTTPPAMWALLLLVGWNEFSATVSSPFGIFLLILVAMAFFFAKTSGVDFDELQDDGVKQMRGVIKSLVGKAALHAAGLNTTAHPSATESASESTDEKHIPKIGKSSRLRKRQQAAAQESSERVEMSDLSADKKND